MRRLFLTLSMLIILGRIYAHEGDLEKSLYGIQLGIYPLSFYNEYRITNSIVLRSELGFSYAWSGGAGINGSNQWAITPDLNLEPRFYYNINRRRTKNKRIDRNSGNYLSISSAYGEGRLAIRTKDTKVFSTVHIIPMYGIRRIMGKHLNFEFAFGMGNSWTFEEYDYVNYVTRETETYKSTNSQFAYGIRLAIGYVF